MPVSRRLSAAARSSTTTSPVRGSGSGHILEAEDVGGPYSCRTACIHARYLSELQGSSPERRRALVTALADAGAESDRERRGLAAVLKDAWNDVRADEDGLTRAEAVSLVLEPLLDLAREDEMISSCSGCLWKSWPLPGSESSTSPKVSPAPSVRRRADEPPARPQSKRRGRKLVRVNRRASRLLSAVGIALKRSHVLGHGDSRSAGAPCSRRRRTRRRRSSARARTRRRPGSAIGPPWQRTRTSGLTSVGGVVHRLDPLHATRRASSRSRAPIVPDGRQAHVRDEDVGARLGHRARVLGREDVGAVSRSSSCAGRIISTSSS